MTSNGDDTVAPNRQTGESSPSSFHDDDDDDDDGQRHPQQVMPLSSPSSLHDEGDDQAAAALLLEDGDPSMVQSIITQSSPQKIVFNFVVLSVLFASNHGCVVACLGLATARLGATGAWQSGVLYATYSFSGIAGSTYVVKTLGARDALILGMGLYVAYVVAFWIATVLPPYKDAAAAVGAVLGGIGAGFLWTAQGAYFAQAATAHALALEQQQQGDHDGLMVAVEDIEQRQRQQQSTENSTAKLAGIFAFIYLAFEVGLRALSTILLETTNLQWSTIFAIYAAVTVASAILMVFVDKLEDYSSTTAVHQQQASAWYKVTAAWQLLRYDPKMKHMIGLNAVFGFTSSFLSSYVNGEVVRVVMQDDESKYVGLYAAWVSCTAAAMSLVFGRLAPRTGKGPILVAGSVCFFLVVAPFLIWPNVQDWGWLCLVCIYSLHGTGRATFEGTLKATFADYFPTEKEGAFANIILQNGLSSALGFILTFTLHCSGWKLEHFGEYCVEYRDGSIHDVLSFELLIVLASVLAIFGYWRASKLYKDELISRSNYENVFTYSSPDDR